MCQMNSRNKNNAFNHEIQTDDGKDLERTLYTIINIKNSEKYRFFFYFNIGV